MKNKENATKQPTLNLHPLSGYKRPFLAPFADKNQLKKQPLPRSDEHQQQSSFYFTVLFTKYQPHKKNRKNKTFEDGVLHIKMPGVKTILYNSEGKVVTSTQLLHACAHPSTLGNGSELVLGSNYEVEIDDIMTEDVFLSGKAFFQTESMPFLPCTTSAPASSSFKKPMLTALPPQHQNLAQADSGTQTLASKSSTAAAPNTKSVAYSIHNPHSPHAIILNADQWQQGNGKDSHGRLVSPVILDPMLARQMRPHQIEGVKFLYRCVMGASEPGYYGAILADCGC